MVVPRRPSSKGFALVVLFFRAHYSSKVYGPLSPPSPARLTMPSAAWAGLASGISERSGALAQAGSAKVTPAPARAVRTSRRRSLI